MLSNGGIGIEAIGLFVVEDFNVTESSSESSSESREYYCPLACTFDSAETVCPAKVKVVETDPAVGCAWFVRSMNTGRALFLPRELVALRPVPPRARRTK